MFRTIGYRVSTKAATVSLYLFVFLFLALYGKQGFQTMNQVILWAFGPLIAFYILQPNLYRLHLIPREYYLYLSMVVFSYLGYINVLNDTLFYRYLQVFIANFVLMITVYFAINNIREWKLAWLTVGLAGLTVAVIGYFLEAPAIDDDHFRLSGITGNSNGTANYARVSIIASLFLLQFAETKLKRLFLWLVIFFLTYTILLTASRGNFANVVFLLGGYLAFKYANGWRLILLLLVIFIFGNIIMYLSEQFLSGFYLFERLTRNESVSAALDEEARLQIYAEAWKYFIENPLLGVGLNQFRIYSEGKISHTDVLDILVQLGIIAGIVYVYMYVKVFKKIMRLKRFFQNKRDVRVYQVMLLCFISEMIFGVSNPNWFTQLQMVVLSLLIIYVTKIRHTNLPLQQQEMNAALTKRRR